MTKFELEMKGAENFKVSGNSLRDLYLEYIIKTMKEKNPDRKLLYDAFVRKYSRKSVSNKQLEFPKGQIESDIFFLAMVDTVKFTDLDFYLVLSETVGDTHRIDEFGIDEHGSNFKIYALYKRLEYDFRKSINFDSFGEDGNFINPFNLTDILNNLFDRVDENKYKSYEDYKDALEYEYDNWYGALDFKIDGENEFKKYCINDYLENKNKNKTPKRR